MAALADPRVEQYARLLVERAVDVRPGWQVIIRSTPLARPLVEACTRLIAQRGAYAILRISWTMWPVDLDWAEEAPLDLLGTLPPVDRNACDSMDARITIMAPENTREEAGLSQERLALVSRARRYFLRRTMSDQIPWVGCQFPTPALAQDAGMTVRGFENFLYGACLLDWDAERERMRRYAERFERARTVRIVGDGTDLTLSVAGRRAEVDDGRNNLPGGEFFLCPIEDSADGVITFGEFPAEQRGREIEGIRLVFREGRVVDASAEIGEEALLATLDTDPGSRRLGELGIGCNPGIRRHMRNALFDEKIDGTVHLALGASYTALGGTNESVIHWDVVKDLRRGGRLELDGEAVQENGRWLF
jgi:aminopeptidase